MAESWPGNQGRKLCIPFANQMHKTLLLNLRCWLYSHPLAECEGQASSWKTEGPTKEEAQAPVAELQQVRGHIKRNAYYVKSPRFWGHYCSSQNGLQSGGQALWGAHRAAMGDREKILQLLLNHIIILTNLGPFLNVHNTLVKCYMYKGIKDTHWKYAQKHLFY